MSRPLRIEFPCAIHHATLRGDRLEPIFVDDGDRHALLAAVAQAMDRFNAAALAYSTTGKHCHFVLHTRPANLSRLMCHLNLKAAAIPVSRASAMVLKGLFDRRFAG